MNDMSATFKGSSHLNDILCISLNELHLLKLFSKSISDELDFSGVTQVLYYSTDFELTFTE